jgi:uncharacterized alpha-E superfamily protein
MALALGAERLAVARTEVRRACDLLIASTPESLNSCPEALERALAALREFSTQGRQMPPEAGAQSLARALQNDVRRAGRLLENLAAFSGGWERILGAMSGGYTASGTPAAVSRRSRLCCRG